LDDNRLLHYSRQIMLPEIGIEGQQKLLDSHVLLIGVGGLGSPIAMYLAAAGVGHLTLVDFDTVDLSNLQRQIVHHTGNIGQAKVKSARKKLRKLNPDCQIDIVESLLDEAQLQQHIQRTDVTVDATDNFSTRFMINRLCVAEHKPLVSGAAIRWEGQITTFDNQPGSACYQCLYGSEGEEDESCTENGVLAPVVGIIGSMQATETIKLLTGSGSTLQGHLLILDALHMQWREIKLKADPKCPVCQKKAG
jgi:adenylyltransferase/sulfurtransferase